MRKAAGEIRATRLWCQPALWLGHPPRLSCGRGHRTFARRTHSLGKSLTYGYDAASNLTDVLRSTGVTTSYGYDADNRVTAITHTSPGAELGCDLGANDLEVGAEGQREVPGSQGWIGPEGHDDVRVRQDEPSHLECGSVVEYLQVRQGGRVAPNSRRGRSPAPAARGTRSCSSGCRSECYRTASTRCVTGRPAPPRSRARRTRADGPLCRCG